MFSFENMLKVRKEHHNYKDNSPSQKQKVFVPKCKDEFQFFLFVKNNAMQIPINENLKLSNIKQSNTFSFLHHEHEDSKMEQFNSVCYLVTSKSVNSFNDIDIPRQFAQIQS